MDAALSALSRYTPLREDVLPIMTGKTNNVGTRKRRKKGSLGQLRGVLWGSLLELERLASESDPETQIKACNALAGLARAYLSCVETSDFEQRITALEDQIHIRSQENGRANVSLIR